MAKELNEDYLEISVTDSGEGIEPDELRKLKSNLEKNIDKVQGIGLSLCHKLIT